jgi:hypothetical protein
MRLMVHLLALSLTAACTSGPAEDDGSDPSTDADFDGYGDDVDCNDLDDQVHPDAIEICDGVDNNCDGEVDEGVLDPWYADLDGDGFGDPESVTLACERPDEYVPNDDDCNDTDASTYVGAEEVCDGVDNDCDGQVDPCRDLDDSDAKLVGESEGDQAGYAVAAAGDINGDGLMDVLIGAPGVDETGGEAGAAYLLHGPLSGEVSLRNADARIFGAETDARVGYALSSVGDLDADGYQDLFIGAWGDDTNGSFAGAAWIVHGPIEGDIDLSQEEIVFFGEKAGDNAGTAVSSAGDVNGDGWIDLLIGAPNYDPGGAISTGSAYLLYGPHSESLELDSADASLRGEATADYAGQRIEGAGDLNGDGFDDMIIAAWGSDTGGSAAGAVYLVNGPVYGEKMLVDADQVLVGEDPGDHAGSSVVSAGDMNDDGYADLFIGSPDHSSEGAGSGAAYLIHGPISIDMSMAGADARLVGSRVGDHVGSAVARVGDVNGDSFPDLAVGAYLEDSGGINAGAVYLMMGPVSGTILVTNSDGGFIGQAASDRAGWSVAGPGDVNGDAIDDVLVGAPDHDQGGANAGAAYLMYVSEL